MIKIFLKSLSVEIHYYEEEGPSIEKVGVQCEEEEEANIIQRASNKQNYYI